MRINTRTCIELNANLCVAMVIVQAIDSSRGQRVLETLDSTLDVSGPSWTQFIAAATKGTAQVWVLIVTVSDLRYLFIAS